MKDLVREVFQLVVRVAELISIPYEKDEQKELLKALSVSSDEELEKVRRWAEELLAEDRRR